jgi:hypothetical protein
MRSHLGALCFCAFLACSPLNNARAQSATTESRNVAPLFYNNAQEITIAGTVHSIVRKATAPLIPGAHVTITTLSGSVDVSLGISALEGAGAPALTQGEQIEVTGINKTLSGSPIFLARTVTFNGTVYEIRNRHGVPISPLARQRSLQSSEKEGHNQ